MCKCARCRWSTRFTKASTQPSLAVPAPMDAAKWSPWWLEVVCRVSLMTLKCSCINLATHLRRCGQTGAVLVTGFKKKSFPLEVRKVTWVPIHQFFGRGPSRQIIKSQPRRPRFGQGQLGKQILRMDLQWKQRKGPGNEELSSIFLLPFFGSAARIFNPRMF